MPVTMIIETDDKSWADAEQTDGGTLIGMLASYEEEHEEGQEFTKADFERDLRKVSRKIKK
ncbi:hypothetical protein ACFLUU_01620 [Chloroflexota bacterium]